MKYIPLECKSAIHKINKKRLPFKYDVNIYRGCQHQCIYCYAIYSHDYISDADNFFDTIYYKKNIVEMLEKKLSSLRYEKSVINLGGICDSYQPIESKLMIMRDILKIMIKYQNPIIISTKSTLILRDLDLIQELAKIVTVNIAFTITTLDDKVQQLIEPGASKSIDRLKVLKRFCQETEAVTGIHIMPIIPYLTDSSQNLETLYHLASDIGVDYVLPGTLYLRGKTRDHFYQKIKAYDYQLSSSLKQLYYDKEKFNNYKKNLYQNIHQYNKKYNLDANYQKAILKHEAKLHQIE